MPFEYERPGGFRVEVPRTAAQTLPQSLGLKISTDVRLLTLLMVAPGVVQSYADLAAAMGVSPQSVHVYAYHLRVWLRVQGFDASLACCCGQGYELSPDVAAALAARLPCLAAVVAVARLLACRNDGVQDTCCASAPVAADPFPQPSHREPLTPPWHWPPATSC